jgi:endonuclease/exonuclease/phosphatase family metal-dependent hydrolase
VPNDLKTRLLIGAGIVALLLVLSCIFGVKKTAQIVSEILTGKKADDHQDDDDDRQRPTDGDKSDDVPPAKAGSYLFCFWNVENLFDDRDDGRKTKADGPYDHFFANDPDALKLKLDHLADVLIPLNDGRGPDLLGIVEVESERAAELLKEVLNKRLGKDAYRVVMKGNPAGRHISPALLSKLPVVKDRTENWGARQRILKTVVSVNGHDLTLVVSHWTSRVTDEAGKGDKRAGYADVIYGKYKASYLAAREKGKNLDFLVCGDFNDNPDDVSVTDHLHATGDLARVKASGKEPMLFDLFAKAYANGEGTHVYKNKKFVFDHVCVSPGLFDDVGWSCDADTAKIVTSFADRKGAPNPFGGPNKKGTRGTSDHFPVTVRLRVR